MSFVDDVFLPKYKQALNGIPERDRGDGFEVIFRELEAKKADFYTILETGCMRPNGTLEGDGQSTRLFAEFLQKHEGILVSLDIDKNAVEYANKTINQKNVNVFIADSVKTLWRANWINNPGLDLIYLDSYDVDFVEPWKSNLHHMKELVCVANLLKRDTILAVDDARFLEGDPRIASGVKAEMVGKAFFVESFMNNIGATKLFDGYQKVWKI